MSQPRVLSVFSGLGGLDLGLESAGFESVGCIEIDAIARQSLATNRATRWPLVPEGNVLKASRSLRPEHLGLRPGELTLLAGGPPCQPYSKAAMWAPTAWNGLDDDKATPLRGFLALVERFQPQALLIENVPGFVRGPRNALQHLRRELAKINKHIDASYEPHAAILDAADFGVPQRRERAFIVALRSGAVFDFPIGTCGDQPVTAWDAIGSLRTDEAPPEATGRWAPLLPSIPEGENYLWHTSRGGGEPLFGYRTRYWSFLLKLAKDQTAWTLPAQPGPSTGPFHWENRPLRIAEMLRLQSFPSDWVVEGGRRERVRQVGNATPPLLAEILGIAVQRALGNAKTGAKPKMVIPHNGKAPRASRTAGVPNEFLRLRAAHAEHPGSGRGPRPRAKT